MTALRALHHPREVMHQGFTLDLEREYKNSTAWGNKPDGLWLSIDNGWAQWCEDNEWGWANMDNGIPFEIDTDKCLWLKSYADIVNFTRVMKEQTPPGGESWERYTWKPDWEKLTPLYSGIIIAPFIYEAHTDSDLFWYYGWDCASACIWDLSAVKITSRLEIES